MRLLHALVCGLFLTAFAACSDAGSPTANPSPAPSGGAVKTGEAPASVTQSTPANDVAPEAPRIDPPITVASAAPSPQSIETPTTVAAAPLAPAPPASPSPTGANNWPSFRGPGGNGVSNDTNLPAEWSATKNMLWTTPLPGPGASSPIVFNGRVYLTCYSGYGVNKDAPGDPAQLKRHLICLNLSDGSIRWTKTLASEQNVWEYRDAMRLHGYASSTPVADESGVYVFYGSSGAVAYTHDGQERWRKSCGTQIHEFGTASSPILYKDLLIIYAEVEAYGLVTLDKNTGEERWRLVHSKGPAMGRSTPAVVRVGDHDELIYGRMWGELGGVDPNSGKLLWTCGTRSAPMNGSPITFGDTVVVTGSHGGRSTAIRLGGSGNVENTHKLWESPKGAYVSSPVYHEGHIYVTQDGGVVSCIDAKTGETVYSERYPSDVVYASPVIADGKLYYVSISKGTFVFDAKPQFRQIAHNVIEGDDSSFNGSPAISGGRILLRSDKAIYCIGNR